MPQGSHITDFFSLVFLEPCSFLSDTSKKVHILRTHFHFSWSQVFLGLDLSRLTGGVTSIPRSNWGLCFLSRQLVFLSHHPSISGEEICLALGVNFCLFHLKNTNLWSRGRAAAVINWITMKKGVIFIISLVSRWRSRFEFLPNQSDSISSNFHTLLLEPLFHDLWL